MKIMSLCPPMFQFHVDQSRCEMESIAGLFTQFMLNFRVESLSRLQFISSSYPHLFSFLPFLSFDFFYSFSPWGCDHTWVLSSQALPLRAYRHGKVGAQCPTPRCSQQEWGQGAEPRGNPTLALVQSVVSQNLPFVCEPQLGRVSCELGLRPSLSAGAKGLVWTWDHAAGWRLTTLSCFIHHC